MALTNARLVEELGAADRIKAEFLSTMSHELRTPLAAVLGYVECLEDSDASVDERRMWLDRIKACGRDLLDLIESTLDIGRLDTGASKLAIVLRNLVGNGFKFTERGNVSVEGKVVEGSFVFHVADTGIGIRREDQTIIFDLFRQADGSESRRYGGTGIGLYIVRRFVEMLGGSIALERGSIFTVTLPGATLAGDARPARGAA